MARSTVLLCLVAAAAARAIRWNPGCLCELKEMATESDFAMPSIFVRQARTFTPVSPLHLPFQPT